LKERLIMSLGTYRGLAFMLVIAVVSVRGWGYDPAEQSSTYDPAKYRAEQLMIWEKFSQKAGGGWRVVWNPVTGTPHRISGSYMKLPEAPTEKTIKKVVYGLLEKHESLLQIDAASTELLKIDRDVSDQKLGPDSWYVYCRQLHKEVPVVGSSVRLILRGYKLVMLGSDSYPGIGISPKPTVDQDKAVALVRKDMGAQEKPVDVTLVVSPEAVSGLIRYHLAWQFTMPVTHMPADMIDPTRSPAPKKKKDFEMAPVQWRYFVDAHQLRIIKRINLAIVGDISGTVTGSIHPLSPTDTPVDVPIADLEVRLSTPMLPGEELLAVSDEFGQWSAAFSDPLPGATCNLESRLEGAHVSVSNSETGSGAVHRATFVTDVWGNGMHSWSWQADDTSPNDVETNAFFHTNLVHRWFQRGDPFDLLPIPYPMPVFVRDGPYCNAGASPSGLTFGSGSSECGFIDWGLCSDVIYHEYAHRIVGAVYTDPTLFPYAGQTGAMNEGWSDYFSCSLTDDPRHGEGCHSGRNIDAPDARFPQDWVDGVHSDGTIFSGPLWDLRTSPPDHSFDTDSLALRGLKQMTLSFSEYLGAFIEEDDSSTYNPLGDDNLGNGSPNIAAICDTYYGAHGIYHPYCFDATTDPVAVITDPAPTRLAFAETTGTVDIIGTAAGGSHPLSAFRVEYSDTLGSGTWHLIASGASEVDDGLLATWDASSLPGGLYTIRLTVTNTDGRSAVAEVQVSLDPFIRPGWPQLAHISFQAPAAAANIDPTTPDLEIVVFGWDNALGSTQLYVFHADGSVYSPWPLACGPTKSAPAIGDLDEDGDQEIVLSTYWGLNVWQHDGTEIFTLGYGAPLPDAMAAFIRMDSSASLADLDGDGDLEIATGSYDGNLYLVHHDGSSFSSGGFTWPKVTTGAMQTSPALVDLDGDGEIEVVAGSHDGYLYAWELDGSDVAGSWPLTFDEAVISSPAVGDMDNDPLHDLELIHGVDDGKIYAWNHDGSLMPGSWPRTLVMPDCWIWGSPALVDLDDDGDLEALINGEQLELRVYEHDGSFRNLDPVIEFLYDSPVVGDLDGDTSPEIAAPTRFFLGALTGLPFTRLVVFHADGTQLAGFQGYMDGAARYGSGLITDLDHDGSAELVAGSRRGLYVWSLTSSHSPSVQPWPTFHHDPGRTGFFGRH
jgi:Zn-dependent metalloprotease